MAKVKLIKSAIGAYNICDPIHTRITVTDEMAEKMIKSGHAEEIKAEAAKDEKPPK